MKHNLTDSELTGVSEVITSRMGLLFSKERRNLLVRGLELAAREFNFHDLREFVNWLGTSRLNNDQIEMLASYLTIGETYFWREPSVFAALSQHTLLELLAARKGREKSLRIWCAACSTGEEAYSIAIAIHRAIPEIKDWKITILATDINTKALSKARKGIYGAWSFRNSPPWLKKNYFKKINEKEFEIVPEIKKMVTFSSFNLTSENYPFPFRENNKMDIIFCRNVLMYFTDEWSVKASDKLYNSLSEDGWLIVSSCELSSILFTKFIPVNFPGAVLYRKGKNGSAHSLSKEALSEVNFNSLTAQPTMLVVEKLKSLNVEIDEFNPSTVQPFNPSTLHQPQPASEETSADQIFAIHLLADQGLLEKALQVCDEAIESDKLAPELYLLRASILQEMNKCNDAINSLKKAIYICPDFIMGHFTLGNIFFRQGNLKNAERYFNNAIELLKELSGSDLPAESEGLSAEYIKGIILTNLQSQRSA